MSALLALCRAILPGKAAGAARPTTAELERQTELGNRAFAALTEAAAANHEPGIPYLSIGRLTVVNWPNNGDRHTVLVRYISTRSAIPYFACQFDVKISEIHVLLGRYGPEESGPLHEFDRLLEATCKHVRNWRLFLPQGS